MESNPLKDRRIKNGDAARTIWNKWRADSQPRRNRWAVVQGQLDGAPPLSNSELVKSGQGWRCNVNFRDAASTLEQVLVSYWRLLHDTTNLGAFTMHGSDPNSEKYEQIFQKNFNRFFDDWGADYVRNYLLFSQNHVAFGVGVVHWSNKYTPRWEVVRLGEVEVPAKAKASIEKISTVAVRQEIEIEELWELIRTPEKRAAAAQRGWNVDELEKELTFAVRNCASVGSVTADDMLEMQRELRNNALGVSTDKSPIRLVHVYVKDYDGKISHCAFVEGVDHSQEFLFDDSESSGRPELMTQIIAAVFFDAGNGDFWGTKGFGVKNFQLASVMNRLKSRAVDRTLLDGLNFIDLSEGGRETVPITNIGPFNFLPKGIEQVSSYPQGRSVLETIEMLEQQQSYNNARYRDQGRQIAQTDTATQANILANLQSQVDVANATLYLKQVAQNLFAEQLRRLRLHGSDDPDAVAFRKRCIDEDGMPKEVFYGAELAVRTGADPGAANMAVQGQKALEAMALPDANRRYFSEKYVAATFGAQAVSKALLPVDATAEIRSVRLALMENSDMGEGNPLPVDPQDNHAAHVPAHLQPLLVIADRYNQTGQIDPNGVIALQMAIPHLAAHFTYLKSDKLQEKLYAETWPQFTAVRSTAEGIFRQIERMQNEAAAAGRAPGVRPSSGFSPAAAVGELSQQ